VLAGLLRSKNREDGWTDNLVTSAMPGFVDWLGDKGDEIARGMQSQPSAAAGDTPTPAPVRPEDLPQRGWLLHYSLDIILPVLMGLVFLIVLSNANDPRGWNWKSLGAGDMEDAIKNPLFRFWYNT